MSAWKTFGVLDAPSRMLHRLLGRRDLHDHRSREMKPWLLLGLCLSPSAIVVLTGLGVWLYDRRRDRRACDRLVAMELAAVERLRSGAAWVEAFALQLDQIQALPEIEPWERSA